MMFGNSVVGHRQKLGFRDGYQEASEDLLFRYENKATSKLAFLHSKPWWGELNGEIEYNGFCVFLRNTISRQRTKSHSRKDFHAKQKLISFYV